MKLEWERPDPKYHPNWWFSYGPNLYSDCFDYEKFETLFFKNFKRARLEIYDRHDAPTIISITFQNAADSARFVLLVEAGTFSL